MDTSKFKTAMQAEGLAKSTVTTYHSLVVKFIQFHKESAQRITTTQIIAYLAGIDSLKTRKQTRWAIAKYYQFLGCPHKMNRVPYVKQAKSLPNFLTEEEIQRLLSVITNTKHYTLLYLTYKAALRISEVVNLKVAHVKGGDQAHLKIVNSKNAKDRNIPLMPETLGQLRHYYKKYRPQEYLFEGASGGTYSQSSIRKVLQSALAKAKIETKITPHDLRHSQATHWHNKGLDIKYIKELLGHSELKTTEIYVHCGINNIANQMRQIEVLDMTEKGIIEYT